MNKSTQELIEKILHEVAEDLIESENNKKDSDIGIGLMSGKTGQSLFLFYYWKFTNNKRYYEYAHTILFNVFDNINNGHLFPTFCDGLAGVASVIIHLIENGFIDEKNYNVLNDIDNYLFKSMKHFINENNFDFLHGATGIVNYFTSRVKKNNDVKKYLEYYTDKLFKYAVYDDKNNTAKIVSPIYNEEKIRSDVYNLSLSHGISSIIVVLSKIYPLSKNSEEIEKYIKGFTNYIISNKNKEKSLNGALYPSSVPINKVIDSRNSTSRLGWCYGDIGNGIAFLSSSSTIKDSSKLYAYKANEIFKNLKNRKNLNIQAINDAGICHVSAGLICIMNSLYRIYNDKIFKDLEDYWVNTTLNFYKNSGSIKGFSKYMNDIYIYDISLLTGTTGVAL